MTLLLGNDDIRRVLTPLKNIRFKLVDPVSVLDQMDKWTKLYQEIVVKRAGP